MDRVRIGIIGGTGVGAHLVPDAPRERHVVSTPFGNPSDVILEADWSGTPVFLLNRHGRGHLIPPGQVNSRANIFALKKLGCTHILASGAVGSLRDEFRPRDLVVPDQVIDRTTRAGRTFFEQAAVHVEFSEPFCPVLRRILTDVAKEMPGGGTGVHGRGTYVCMEGPAFSTRAESHMHRLMGGDLIGMTLMPEAKLAREAEMAYAAVALVTDYDCWKPHPPWDKQASPDSLLSEIISHLHHATESAAELMRRTVGRIAADPSTLMESPALHSLRQAIWSEKNLISREEVERLAPVWGRYFEGVPSPGGVSS
jgi:5'-methylthioadenosine phosphorylase